MNLIFEVHFFMQPVIQHNRNAITSTATIVEPTGVPAIIDIMSPDIAQTTAKIAEKTVTFLKLWKSRIDESAGKMIRAEIRSEPTRFMASTITTAITTAIRKL